MKLLIVLEIFAVLSTFQLDMALAHGAGCPGSSDSPVLSVEINTGISLFVCGFEDTDKVPPKGKRLLSEFIVYSTGTTKQVKKIFEVGALENYWVTPDPKHGLILEELWWIKDTFAPALRRKISCTKKECTLGPVECALKVSQDAYPNALTELRKKLQNGATNGSNDLSKLISHVFAQSLGGDLKPHAFFLGESIPRGLDGAAAEEWTTSRERLARAKKYNCLSP